MLVLTKELHLHWLDLVVLESAIHVTRVEKETNIKQL